MNLLFLDITGVLTTSNPSVDLLDPDKVALLSETLDRVPCSVVVSSSHREFYPLHEIVKMLITSGLDSRHTTRFIGATPVLRSDNRGEEITEYLRNFPDSSVAILDDQPITGAASVYWVQINPVLGLTLDNADTVVRYLTS